MKLGLVVNPYAGLGGAAGLKGSDSDNTLVIATERGVQSQVGQRVRSVFVALQDLADCLNIITVTGNMGGHHLQPLYMSYHAIDLAFPVRTRGEHTRQAVRALQGYGIDLLVFVGGDGTAHDVADAALEDQIVLGIPSGVKMHSGVFATTPNNAAKVIRDMALGHLVTVTRGEVRDLDESALQRGQIKVQYGGELWVPEALRYIQAVKSSGQEQPALVIEEIAAAVVEQLESNLIYFIGSGSTTAGLMRQLNLPNTLLGVDVIQAGQVLQSDAFEAQLYRYSRQEHCKIIITVIGGQGHIFGRGNQQFSARVIRQVGLENIIVIATKTKLESLKQGLIVDTGDWSLDQQLSGFIRVITGYEDSVLCPVSC